MAVYVSGNHPSFPKQRFNGSISEKNWINKINTVNQRYYFDANALLKYYQDEKGSLKIRRLVSNSSSPILISSLTVLECLTVVIKSYRQGVFKKKKAKNIINRLKRDRDIHINGKPRLFQVVPIRLITYQFSLSH
jgi:hypothetical protein